MDTLINMKNNLIQNFYIIGLDPEDFFHINQNNEGEFLNIFQNFNSVHIKEKLISKFPPKNSNFNGINDQTIINHCFPNGLFLIKGNSKKKAPLYFFFELDNLLFNYTTEEKNIYSKIYLTCIEIYEPLNNYISYKNQIISKLDQKIKFNDKKISNNEKYELIYVPKVLCLASVLPFYKELKDILDFIYKYYLENNNYLRLEKLIEEIILKIPIPLNYNQRIKLKFEESKNKINYITFPLHQIKEENIKNYFTNSFNIIYIYFTVDNIIKIFKYIILEIPILFFCENRNHLTSLIESFLSLISPFKYIHPHISILPQKFFGFISCEKKFIFGINQKYSSDFFKNNDIEIDKNIVIVYTEKVEGKIDIIYKNNENNNDILTIDEEVDEEKNFENNFIDNDYVVFNGTKTELINIELPSDKKALYDDLNKYKSKSDEDYNYKVRNFFLNFFVNILSGYTEFYLNSKYFFESSSTTKNCGDEIFYKKDLKKNMTDINFVKENFNLEEFINKSDCPLFYFVFCQTKLFSNFIRERIYYNDKINSMRYRQFDQLCFLRKHKDYRKKKENKGIYESFKKIELEKNKKAEIKEISIKNSEFNKYEIELIKKKDKNMILIKYAQNIFEENNELNIKYDIFPKLLFDDEFFETKYENLFLNHDIEMPHSRIIEDYKILCRSYSNEYYKLRSYMFPPASLEQLPSTNASKINFGITSYFYIFYDWIILLCASLWYCDDVEKIIRLNSILDILDKLDYIEEIVIKLCFNTFMKYANKTQCVQVYEKLMKFYGNNNYLYLNLLTNKLCEKEKSSYQNENIDNNNSNKEYILKDRSYVFSFESFIQKRISLPITNENKNQYNKFKRNTIMIPKLDKKNNNEIKYKERIIFSSEQYCKKCKCYNSFDFEEVKKQKLSKINYTYKCIKCKSLKNDVIIKYQVLLQNKKRNELYITKMGEFKLLPPNRLYKELIYNLTSKKVWEINIEKITTEYQINLMNFIFYFSTEQLSFDFLLPYKKLDDDNFDIIQNNLCSYISNINKKRFSVMGKVESDDISKGLIENKGSDNFIPIDISNFDKYFDLTPCLADNTQDDYLYEEINK